MEFYGGSNSGHLSHSDRLDLSTTALIYIEKLNLYLGHHGCSGLRNRFVFLLSGGLERGCKAYGGLLSPNFKILKIWITICL